jgi:hypothetical protein
MANAANINTPKKTVGLASAIKKVIRVKKPKTTANGSSIYVRIRYSGIMN